MGKNIHLIGMFVVVAILLTACDAETSSGGKRGAATSHDRDSLSDDDFGSVANT
jgi:hypothetical protein